MTAATAFAAPGVVTAVAAAAIAVLMVGLWALSVHLHDVSIVDPVWGPAFVLVALRLFFEAVGDEQMRRFKAGPASRGQVMDRGLWLYTRHPNYFGDFCVWWGLWLIALPAGGTWWTLIGPMVMTILLVGVSGKALTERDIGERRPEYAEYVKRTSGFFPLPPRG